MQKQEPKAPSRALARALFLVVLAASLSLKLLAVPDARAESPEAEAALREGLRAFLAAEGFAAEAEDGFSGMPAALGERGACRVLLASVAPQGYHRDLIFSKASPEDKVAFLFRGQAYADQPGWSTWAARILAQLHLAGTAPAAEGGNGRVFALLTNGPCGIDAPLWAERLAGTAL